MPQYKKRLIFTLYDFISLHRRHLYGIFSMSAAAYISKLAVFASRLALLSIFITARKAYRLFCWFYAILFAVGYIVLVVYSCRCQKAERL